MTSDIQNCNIISYTKQIEDFYALADIVLTRGGSNVLFELLALKKPMLIVPLEKGSRGDQVLNAKVFEKEKIAKSVLENQLENDKTLLAKKLDEVWKIRTDLIKNMQNKNVIGNKKIVEQIEKYVK